MAMNACLCTFFFVLLHYMRCDWAGDACIETHRVWLEKRNVKCWYLRMTENAQRTKRKCTKSCTKGKRQSKMHMKEIYLYRYITMARVK